MSHTPTDAVQTARMASNFRQLLLLLAVLTAWLLTPFGVANAQSDDCFTLPNGTKFCSSRTQKPVPAPREARRRNASEGAKVDKRGQRRHRGRSAIRAAGGHRYLVERFDVSAVPSLELAGPCLCRDGSKPVYGFCTGREGTYKVSCPR